MVIINHRLRLVNFNSIKVRLEQVKGQRVPITLPNFNSIKVRLELRDQLLRCRSCQFQFHKGAIRTSPAVGIVDSLQLFQFHKGAIRTNSCVPSLCVENEFQFHKGAIRTTTCKIAKTITFISIP